jgi:Nif-specific regulatory protein
MFARALHLASPRRKAPFIKVNCAAIPETLFESELFGHEKGAFTGAVAGRAGWFEQADTGTIFLDEIGEMPLAMQGKLLRTLQEGTVIRLGGKQEKRIDVRLVAATNRDLAQEVVAGRFREDLFYRLNVIPIRLPALGERIGDVPLLATHFLTRFNQENQRNVNFTDAAMQRLKQNSWPGNIRQLSNVIERVVLLCARPLVDDMDLEPFLSEEAAPGLRGLAGSTSTVPEQLRAQAPAPPSGAPASMPAPAFSFRPYARADLHSHAQLAQALATAGGNKTRAAHLLGLTERQFSYRWSKSAQ